MSLLASTIGLNKAALVTLVGSSDDVNRYAGNVDANITTALDSAADAFRSAAIKGGYSSTSVDALTSTTCPDSVKRWILHLSLDELSSGGMGRSEEIGKYGDLARQWLSRLAGGAETIDALSSTTTTGGAQVRIGAPDENVFDRSNVSQRFNLRDPCI